MPAADPTTGMVYVNAQDTSLVGWVERKETPESYSFDANSSDQPYDRASVDGKGPFFSFSAPISGQYDANGRPQGPQAPCYKPPWGELVAVNANTGAIAWSATPAAPARRSPPAAWISSARPTTGASALSTLRPASSCGRPSCAPTPMPTR